MNISASNKAGRMGIPPRILHVITRLDTGGSAMNTIVSADRLREHGFETVLVYGRTHDPDSAVQRELERRRLDARLMAVLVRNPAPVRDCMAIAALGRLLAQEKFDLMHTHTSKAGILGRIAANQRGVPVVHTPHGHIFYGYFNFLTTAVFVGLERIMARRTARIVSLTDEETRESLARRIGKPSQYVTIPSGVPLAKFRDAIAVDGERFRAKLGLPVNAFVFVSVGRLARVKGYDLLLDAFARVRFKADRPTWLLIVGDGAERGALEAQAHRLGISDRVCFTGELTDVRGALKAGQAFVLASRNEGMGRAFVEAMAAGLPAIGPAVGGVGAIIKNRHNGLLVPAANADAMAQAMQTLAEDEPARAAMAARAADSMYPAYDEETLITRQAALYNELLRQCP